MSEMDFETRVRSIAQRMNYPHTPDIAGRVMPRIVPVTKPRFISKGWAWSLTLIVVVLFSLMLIPPVRAAVRRSTALMRASSSRGLNGFGR